MKQFIAFTRKEFLHIFRDGRTMLILLVMPIVLICIFGFAISTEVKSTRVIIIEQNGTGGAHHEQVLRLTEKLEANHFFQVVQTGTDARHADKALQQGSADVIIIMDDKRGIQLLADGSEPNQAQTRMGYLRTVIASAAPTTSSLLPSTSYLFNPQLRSEYNFVPGIIGVIVMLICVMMTSISIVREKETGTMEVLLASPLPPSVIVGAKLIPYFLISSINLVSILLLAKFAFGLPIGAVGVGWTAVPSFLLLSMVYVFVALALGLFISCVVNSQLAAMLLSLLLIVPAIYLSGMVFPLESMPTAFQRVSNVIPTRWYIDGARRLLIQGVAFRHVLQDFAVLCVEAVALVTLSIRLFKTRLE